MNEFKKTPGWVYVAVVVMVLLLISLCSSCSGSLIKEGVEIADMIVHGESSKIKKNLQLKYSDFKLIWVDECKSQYLFFKKCERVRRWVRKDGVTLTPEEERVLNETFK